jgi:hypothetical protein
MSREDLLDGIICNECGHIAKVHGLSQCYGKQKCECDNKLGILIAVLEEDANWSSCELEDTKKELEYQVKRRAEETSMSNKNDIVLQKQLDIAMSRLQVTNNWINKSGRGNEPLWKGVRLGNESALAKIEKLNKGNEGIDK